MSKPQGEYVKGYMTDAALDVVMVEGGVIPPGFSRVKLPVKYKPALGEVAIVSARTSALNAGIFTPIGLIDPEYDGYISAWVFNCSGVNYNYAPGDRIFSVVNLKLAPDRMPFTALNITGKRGTNKLGSTGGHNGNS